MRRVRPGLLGLLLVLSGASVAAHHAFTAEFDANRPIQFTGTVTKMEWVNPHSWIYVDVKMPDGSTQNWAIEVGTPNTLLRRGLTKADLPTGTKIKVTGYQSKDGGFRANGSNITLPDGRSLFLGSAGTGSPDDPKDGKGK
jgi:hypothetical protein